jgi:hypothetical protein
MIQRIQSLYLLLSGIISMTLFFIPLYAFETVDTGPVTGNAQHGYVTAVPAYFIGNFLAGILSLVILFLYKNRKLQVILCNLDMFVVCLFIGIIFYFADHSKPPGSLVHYEAGTYFPLIQLVLLFLSIRAIKKDEELVRSADRLR